MSSLMDLFGDDEPVPPVQPAPVAPVAPVVPAQTPLSTQPQPPAAAPRPLAPQRRIYSVSEVNGRIRGLLEETFDEVWIEGEL